MKQKLRVIILGAGGIGCYYGVRLLSNGHDVTFIARGEHLDAINKNGLRLTHPTCNFSGSITAMNFEQLKRKEKPENFDFIFLTTKATSTQNIASELGRWFKETQQSVAVISLQNGVENEQILCEHMDKTRVFGGLAIKIGGHITEPGIVEAKGVAEIKMGVWPNERESDTQYRARLENWSKAMNEAQIPTEIVKDIHHEQWAKLAINNGVNPLSVLTGLDTKTLSHDPLLGTIVHHLMQETALVAGVDGVNLTDEDVNQMYEVIQNFEAIKTSMLVDWEKAQKLEIDAIPGVIINRADKGNIEVPYTQTIYALLQQKISERNHSS